MSLQGFDEKGEGRASLEAAGAQDAPDTLTPALARLAACTLGGLAVLDDEADGLFASVVGRLHAGVFQEGKVFPAVLSEAVVPLAHLAVALAPIRCRLIF